MSNHEKLFTYLVGNREDSTLDNQSYLLGDRSRHKVMMISGEWGSGKTYFWNDIIKTKLSSNHKNVYISLYGKESIKAIENELSIKAYNIVLDRADGETDLIEKIFSSFALPVSALLGTDSEDTQARNLQAKYKKASEAIDNDLIICFDDFERKSSLVDLNDLFGFITNLSIQFKCKIVIILNSEFFSGDDAEVFARVKEKTVNKYLHYVPSTEYLFKQIINSNDFALPEEIIKKTIEYTKLTGLLNARVYEQLLSNINEYIQKKDSITPRLLKVLVLNTIFFNLHHQVIIVKDIAPASGNIIKGYGGGKQSIDYSLIVNADPITNKIKNIIPKLNFSTYDTFRQNLLQELDSGSSNGEAVEYTKEHCRKLYYLFKYLHVYNIYDSEYRSFYSDIVEVNDFIKTGVLS